MFVRPSSALSSSPLVLPLPPKSTASDTSSTLPLLFSSYYSRHVCVCVPMPMPTLTKVHTQWSTTYSRPRYTRYVPSIIYLLECSTKIHVSLNCLVFMIWNPWYVSFQRGWIIKTFQFTNKLRSSHYLVKQRQALYYEDWNLPELKCHFNGYG